MWVRPNANADFGQAHTVTVAPLPNATATGSGTAALDEVAVTAATGVNTLELGRLVILEAANYIDLKLLEYTDTQTSRTASASLMNTTLAEHFPSTVSSVRGVLVAMQVAGTINSDKIKDETSNVAVYVYYGTEYNTTPGTYNHLKGAQQYNSGTSRAENFTFALTDQCSMPVVYDGDTPYLTWLLSGQWSGMTSASSTYSVSATMYLLGLYV